MSEPKSNQNASLHWELKVQAEGTEWVDHCQEAQVGVQVA